MQLVGNETPTNDPNFIESTILSDLMGDYEERVTAPSPSLVEVLNLSMYEMGLSLSKLIAVSPSRVSEYLYGKSEPPLRIARVISKKFNISASIVLGV